MQGRLMPLVVFATALCLVVASPAFATYYYYSVADDDFQDDNDTLWNALSPWPEWEYGNATLRDNWDADDGNRSDGRDSMYDDLEWYASNLVSGDVLLYGYWGHGGWTGNDSYYPDEGSTTQPQSNDPTPSGSAPYQYDEFFGYSGGTMYMWDDDLRETFSSFDSCVEVIVVSGACHSGGWVGGSHDVDTSKPATDNGLYALLGAPEHGTGIGVKEVGETYYEILLCTALSNSLDAFMTIGDWYTAATEYGEIHSYNMALYGNPAKDIYYWPDENWVPSTYEDTYWTDHWGWEENYFQLRPENWSSLDEEHDRYMATPEPGTLALMGFGLLGVALMRRRKREA